MRMKLSDAIGAGLLKAQALQEISLTYGRSKIKRLDIDRLDETFVHKQSKVGNINNYSLILKGPPFLTKRSKLTEGKRQLHWQFSLSRLPGCPLTSKRIHASREVAFNLICETGILDRLKKQAGLSQTYNM